MTGQEVRLIDIAADIRRDGVFDALHGASDSATFANALKQAAAGYYGTAGPAFVKALIGNKRHRERFRSLAANYANTWIKALDGAAKGSIERVLGHFAVIAVAGELATKFGITGWQTGDAWKSAFELSREWVDAQDGSQQWQIKAAVERTRAFLLAHGDTRFEEARSTPMANRAGYRDDKWFFILRDAWNAIHAGHSPTDQARHLIAGRWMAHGDGKNLMSKAPGWVPGRPRAYKVRATILDAAVGASVPTNAP